MGERPNKEYAIEVEFRAMEPGFHAFIRIRGKIGREAVPGGPFPSSDTAEIAAAKLMQNALNGRTRSRRKHGYTRISGAGLSEALLDLGMSPTDFAIIYGTTVERVLMWIDNTEDVPHPVRVLLRLLCLPGVLEAAQDETDAAIRED